jgi:hypothetical protein
MTGVQCLAIHSTAKNNKKIKGLIRQEGIIIRNTDIPKNLRFDGNSFCP